MNTRANSKQLRAASNNRPRNMGIGLRRQSTTEPVSARRVSLSHSSRALMIYLGWVRLFQTIVSPDCVPAARSQFRREL
jgi:hypothetical protein